MLNDKFKNKQHKWKIRLRWPCVRRSLLEHGVRYPVLCARGWWRVVHCSNVVWWRVTLCGGVVVWFNFIASLIQLSAHFHQPHRFQSRSKRGQHMMRILPWHSVQLFFFFAVIATYCMQHMPTDWQTIVSCSGVHRTIQCNKCSNANQNRKKSLSTASHFEQQSHKQILLNRCKTITFERRRLMDGRWTQNNNTHKHIWSQHKEK